MRCRNPFLAVALSALVLSSGFCLLWAEPALSLTPGQGASGAGNSATPAGAKTAQAAPWQGSQLANHSPRAEMYYAGLWGVSELSVKVAESGELIRFNYRVLDPAKAAALNDKRRSLS